MRERSCSPDRSRRILVPQEAHPGREMAESAPEPVDRRPPAAAASSDVFISYASQDKVVADGVCEALEQVGFVCWIAPRDVSPGEFYADAIVRALNAARILVLVLTKDAVASPHVLREVERTSSKRHPILPAAFEYFLSASHWLDATVSGVDSALPKLVEAVRRLVAPTCATDPAKPTADLYPPPPITKQGRRLSHLVVALSAVIAAVVAYLVVDKLWLAKHTAAERPVASVPARAVPAIPEKSVAVLPFLDMSEKKDQEYFSDGLSEELIDMLTKVPELRVPALTSSFYFKGKRVTISDIAKALSVANVLEGSVRKSGNQLRVTAQLVRADTGYHLWSETYERQLDDLFKVQDEIAGAVVKALKISLMGGSLPESMGTRNVAAHDLFLQSRTILRGAHERADYERGVEYARRAVNADPRYADGYALLALALADEADFLTHESAEGTGDQLIVESRRAARRALSLDPGLSEAHLAYAQLLLYSDLDVGGAETQIQQALKLNPNSQWALAGTGYFAKIRGQFDKALELVRKSIAIDPVNPGRYADLADVYQFAGKYSEALDAYRQWLNLDPRAQEDYDESVAWVWLAKGSPASALNAIEHDQPARENCPCVVLAYDALGRRAEADAALANLRERHSRDKPYGIGLVYASRGDLDQAFDWFDRAYRQHDADILNLKIDPHAKNVRSDPRFNALLSKLELLD
jgi:TolB-like protein/Flp pilus assembly protein TadD